MPIRDMSEAHRVKVSGRLLVSAGAPGSGFLEVWVNTWHLWTATGITGFDRISVLNTFLTAYNDLMNDDGFVESVSVDEATLSDWNGSEFVQVAQRDNVSAPLQDTVSSLPPQCAEVVSLTGEDLYTSGRPVRGRVFLPPFSAAAVDEGGMLHTALAVRIMNEVVQMGNELQDIVDDIHIAIYSPKLNGLSAAIGLRVGNVIDTQRRRRNRAIENFQESSLPIPA